MYEKTSQCKTTSNRVITFAILSHIAATDAAYCYRRSSVVCLSICWSRLWVMKNGWADQDAIVGLIIVSQRNHCIRWGRDPPRERASFLGCPVHCNALGVCAAVYAANGSIPSPVTVRYAMQPSPNIFDRLFRSRDFRLARLMYSETGNAVRCWVRRATTLRRVFRLLSAIITVRDGSVNRRVCVYRMHLSRCDKMGYFSFHVDNASVATRQLASSSFSLWIDQSPLANVSMYASRLCLSRSVVVCCHKELTWQDHICVDFSNCSWRNLVT